MNRRAVGAGIGAALGLWLLGYLFWTPGSPGRVLLSSEARRCRAEVCPDGIAHVGRGDRCVADRGNSEEFHAAKEKVALAHCLDQCQPDYALMKCWGARIKTESSGPWEE
jgi:hypothetical protein